MPVGDLPGWTQIFTDDFLTPIPVGSFPGLTSTGKWASYPRGWPDTSRNGTYDPANISVHDGVMDIHLRYEGGEYHVAAPLPNINGSGVGRDQLYGRYAIRFKADSVDAYKTAWLLWPKSEQWPRDGEIDFPEGELDSTINAYMHRQNGTSGGDQDAYETGIPFGATWHTAVIEWAPNSCRFILDGNVIGHSTNRVPNTPMHWVIQTETRIGSPPPTSAAGHVLIDWVAVWSYAP